MFRAGSYKVDFEIKPGTDIKEFEKQHFIEHITMQDIINFYTSKNDKKLELSKLLDDSWRLTKTIKQYQAQIIVNAFKIFSNEFSSNTNTQLKSIKIKTDKDDVIRIIGVYKKRPWWSFKTLSGYERSK